MRSEILAAVLAPGKKLLIKELCQEYGIGLSPVREALNRLSSEGLVVQSAQKGFKVVSFSLTELEELYETKNWLNGIGLRRSIERGDAVWEERVVVTFHRLSRTPRHLSTENRARNPAWDKAHRVFHATLLDACGSQWLKGFCGVLFDASERYRALARLSRSSRLTHTDEHRAITEATVDRDADKAVALLERHFARTAELVRANLLHLDPK